MAETTGRIFVGKEERMFADKRRVSRQEFLRLGGAGLVGAGLLLGSVGCGGGEGRTSRVRTFGV